MITLSNDDRRDDVAVSFDTSDLIEAIAICGVIYTQWRDGNSEIHAANPTSPRHLKHVGGFSYMDISGYPREPKTSFNGKVLPISRVVAMGIGIDKPLTPLFRALWMGGVDIDGDDMPDTIGDFAESIVAFVELENEEREAAV